MAEEMVTMVNINELYDLAEDLGEVADICPKDIKAHSWYCEDHYIKGCCDKTKCWCDWFKEHSWGGGPIPLTILLEWSHKNG